jgi:hypothetical protein
MSLMHGQIINTIDIRPDEHHCIIITFFLEILAVILLYVIAYNSLNTLHCTRTCADGLSRNIFQTLKCECPLYIHKECDNGIHLMLKCITFI